MDPDLIDEIQARLGKLYPDLDTSAFGITGRILRLARSLEVMRAAHLQSFDLTPGDFDVLATIRRRQDKGGLNPGQVLESVLITSGGLTKRIDRLEKAGLIERHPDPGDRRGTLLRLTPAGRKRIDQAISSLLEMEHEKVTAALGDRRVVESANLLRRLTASLDT
jgi:DNA-binding MarR family transcriptional regulator